MPVLCKRHKPEQDQVRLKCSAGMNSFGQDEQDRQDAEKETGSGPSCESCPKSPDDMSWTKSELTPNDERDPPPAITATTEPRGPRRLDRRDGWAMSCRTMNQDSSQCRAMNAHWAAGMKLDGVLWPLRATEELTCTRAQPSHFPNTVLAEMAHVSAVAAEGGRKYYRSHRTVRRTASALEAQRKA
jgi:hypothetical protein